MKTYTISELAREFSVTPRALRFYEDKGLLSPQRDGLNRIYSHGDRTRLKLILRGKSVGFSLNDIAEMLNIYKLEGQEAQLRLAQRKCREQMENLKKQKQDIEDALTALDADLTWVDEQLQGAASGNGNGAAMGHVRGMSHNGLGETRA